MKKQTKKPNLATKTPSNRKSRRKSIVIALLALFLVAQLVFDVVVIWRHVTSFPQSEPAVATTIFKAINNIYSPAPIEAESGKQYVANARLVVPASEINDMLYSYTSADQDVPQTISFTTRQMINYGESQTVGAYYDSYAASAFSLDRERGAFEALFDKLPSLQACARGVQIFEVAQTEDTLTEQGAKQLQDGRTLHFYTEDQCEQQDQLNDLLEVVKRIDSY